MKISPFTREKLATLMGSHPAVKEFCDALEKATESSPSEVAPHVAELDRNVSALATETAIAVSDLQRRLAALEVAVPTPEPEQEPDRGPISGIEPGTEPAKKKSRSR